DGYCLAGESVTPLRSAELIPWFVIGPRKDLLAARLVLQNNRKLRTSLRCLQNIFITVALWIHDKGFEFFIDFKHVRSNGNAIIVSLAITLVYDDFHLASFDGNKLKPELFRNKWCSATSCPIPAKQHDRERHQKRRLSAADKSTHIGPAGHRKDQCLQAKR